MVFVIHRPDDLQFMRAAIEAAKDGLGEGQTPFGACIVREGKILSLGHNRVWMAGDITAHAEVNAIRAACRNIGSIDLSGCTIYSTCEPCPMCFSAALWARIDRVVFGAGIEDAACAGFNEIPISNRVLKDLGKSPVLIEEGLLRDECAALFKLWEQSGEKRTY